VLAATAIGNFVEWFDSAAYAVMSVTIAGLFFPRYDNTAAFARHLGGLRRWIHCAADRAAFFGHYGDRVGRNRMLALTVLTMSGATVLLGLLPDLPDNRSGGPDPLFLLRTVQGSSALGCSTTGRRPSS